MPAKNPGDILSISISRSSGGGSMSDKEIIQLGELGEFVFMV
jgi:hypothetical protein